MRNILFKAKTEEGKWLEGYLHKIDGKGKGYRAFAIQVQDIDTAMCRPHSHEVIPETIGQFTGLTDKNGKKIFEGDIVKIFWDNDDSVTSIGDIRYSETHCSFLWYIEGKFPCGFDTTKMEVIGNIHEQ